MTQSHHQPQSSGPIPLTKASQILIVGAGTFGLSTAFHLLGRGYTNVTVLDRAKELPAVDAAGTDINKVVRSCYDDVFYTKLAREAMEAWREPVWQECYHECGVINVGCNKVNDRLKENDRHVGASIEDLPNSKAVRNKLLSSLHVFTPIQSDSETPTELVGPLTNYRGYFNSEGGWAEAARAVRILLMRVREMGGRVIEDQEVIGLVKDKNGWTMGVKCTDGKLFEGDRIILTIGSWTASVFPELELDSKCLAAGQSVAMIQLSKEEQERYKGCHVYLDFDTGFYTFPLTITSYWNVLPNLTLSRNKAGAPLFLGGHCYILQDLDPAGNDQVFFQTSEEIRPPTEDGTVKLAIHTAGHTHMIPPRQTSNDVCHSTVRKISTPRTIISHPHLGDGLRVPRQTLRALRDQLKKVYPDLADKPWAATRLCWYTDSPDGNWVIGPFPGDPTLLLATSGSGHGFKFLPNIGRLIVDSLEGILDTETQSRFAVDRDVMGAKNGERASLTTHELDIEDLCGPEDEA